MCLILSKSMQFCAVCAWLVQGETLYPAQSINHIKHGVIYICAGCAGYSACARTCKIIITRVIFYAVNVFNVILFSRARVKPYAQTEQSNNNNKIHILNLVQGLKLTMHKTTLPCTNKYLQGTQS
jgi:hypothetical protein